MVYHICHADVECEEFKNFLKGVLVKFVNVDFTNEKRVLGQIGLVVGDPFDLQKEGLVPSLDHLQCLPWQEPWFILRTVN